MHGSTVVIIGGATRMGLATAHAALAAGARIILASRNADKLTSAVATLGDRAAFVVTDATDAGQIEHLYRSLAPIDHVVLTAASTDAPASSIAETPPDIAQRAFQRYWMSYNVLHFAPVGLVRTGSITLLSGSSARTPARGYGVWGSLHGSINALVKQSAIDLAPIRVNAVSPGGIGIRADRQLAEHHGQFEDVANMIVAVMSNPAVTATIIDVDNGERLGTWSG